eukprot:TRINITY_DN2304_c0_g1_i2.p1 TRINITY_DN2304_c0_g1~~TRINITY_DN2304_c0_g1_i2.p1  ORF type:complete len:276 (+),score=31.07 TRINITY_DN2304_c0_g1_i2:125-829(+)
MDGKIFVTVESCKQVLSYDIHGVDPKCYDTPYDAHGCGIIIHEGADCTAPGRPYYKFDAIQEDPWRTAKYKSSDATYHHGATAKDVEIYTGLGAHDIAGKTLVIYDYNGHALACSQLLPVKVLYTPHLVPFHDSHGKSSCTSGEIYVSTTNRHQLLSYDLHGVDPRCSETEFIPKKGCAIRIHDGESCNDIGESLWNEDEVKPDPWWEVRYYAVLEIGRRAKESAFSPACLRRM